MLKGRNDFQGISLKPKKVKNQCILSGSPDSCDSNEDDKKLFHFKLLSKEDKEFSNSKSNKSFKPKCKKNKKNLNIINIIVGDRKIEKALKAYNAKYDAVKENKSNSKMLKDMFSKLNIKYTKQKFCRKDGKSLKLKTSRGKSKESNKESRNSSKSRCTSNLGLKKRTTFKKDDIIHDRKKVENKLLEEKIKEAFKALNKPQRNSNLGLNTVRYTHRPTDNLRGKEDRYYDPTKTLDELTDTGLCYNFLDQLELTERSCLSVSEPERFINLKDKTNCFSSFGLDEGLGEPEQESKDQKKICSRLKIQIFKSRGDCSQYNKNKAKKSANHFKLENNELNDESFNLYHGPLTTRNNKLINFYDYDYENNSNIKNCLYIIK